MKCFDQLHGNMGFTSLKGLALENNNCDDNKLVLFHIDRQVEDVNVNLGIVYSPSSQALSIITRTLDCE